jgi:hypothetical protein
MSLSNQLKIKPMNLKNLFITSFFLSAILICNAQENFNGSVVKQNYIQLSFKTNVKLQDTISISIKRLEIDHYLIPYGGIERFVNTQDFGSATLLSKVMLGNSGIIQYEDHKVKPGNAYIYWLQSPGGNKIAGPLFLKVRDPDMWWSQEKIDSTIDWLVQTQPEIVKKHTFGKTVEGNVINGLLVGNLNNPILLIGYTHAGESGAELLLYSIEKILTDNKRLLDKTGIIVIPVLNIDSRNLLINGIPGYLRKNSNGVDLNRNYPADWDVNSTKDPYSGTYRGPAPGSEPETQSIIRAIDQFKPKLVLDYHWMGTITGCNLLSYTEQPEILPELNQYAKCFYDGYYKNAQNPPEVKISKSSNTATTTRYCVQIKNIPAFTVEGDRLDPILARTHNDLANNEDLKISQGKHYQALISVLEYVSNTYKRSSNKQ